MGTTRVAKNAGSLNSVYVLAIEGYPYLITNARTPAAAVTAWAGSDWSQALPGLYVEELLDDQALDPYQPFRDGGRCVFRVAPTRGQDRFGVDTHRKYSGSETQLAATLDRDDTTATVSSTADLPSSGHVHIGTECIAYSGKTDTTLTGLQRAQFMPLRTSATGTGQFAQQHRVAVDAHSVLLQPVVSTQPRVWLGRWATVYEHRVVGDVLDVRAEAELVFAGRIAEVYDDGQATVVELEHVLSVINQATVGRQLWSATVTEGVYLFAPQRFRFADSQDAWATVRTADELLVVTSITDPDNQILEGYYTVEDLHARLNAWWAHELAEGNLYGEYTIAIRASAEPRTQIVWQLSGNPRFRLVMPDSVRRFFGFGQAEPYTVVAAHSFVDGSGPPGALNYLVATDAPLRSLVDKFTNSDPLNNAGLRFEVEDERGVFLDQFASMPQAMKGGLLDAGGLEWGLFMFDDTVLIRAAKVGNEIKRVLMPPVNLGARYADDLEAYAVPWDDATPEISIRQILVVEAPVAALVNLIFHSTGTAGHNHDQYDALAFGMGIAIPGELLGAEFESSVAALPASTDRSLAVIDKAMTLKDIIDGDLILRRAFLFWKNGKLRFGTWRIPSTADAVAALDESNKAAPSGNTEDHRTASRETDQWQRPVVRIYYDRDVTDLSTNEGYRSQVTLEDSTAVDDGGGQGALLTIKVRNAYSEGAGAGANIRDLISSFLATMPAFTSRPGRKLTRSISPTLYDQLAVGDVVILNDEHARDPITGERGIDSLAVLVVGKTSGPGGKAFGAEASADATGTVDLLLPLSNPSQTSSSYAPTADVDETYETGDFEGGYDPNTNTLRCFNYRYSDDGTLIAPVLSDANWFPAGAKIKVVERDPLDPAAPQSWDRGVTSQTGDDIVHDGAALSAWDPTKKYRVYVDTYSDTTSLQKQHTFQADAGTGLIETSAPPYQYSSWPSGTSQYAANMNATIGVELPADITFGDGSGRDVGTEQALVRLGDRFVDYKSALSLPVLSNTVLENDEYEGGFLLLAMSPVFLSREVLSSDVWRTLGLSPWFRSSSGESVQLRASLCRSQPAGFSLEDIDRGPYVAAGTWTTTNTNWNAGARIELDVRMKAFNGLAWLLIEGTYGCQTRGLSRAAESPRLFENEWWVP